LDNGTGKKEKCVAAYHQQRTFTFQVLDVASYFLFKTLVNYIKKDGAIIVVIAW
jgi:hypothetical protein